MTGKTFTCWRRRSSAAWRRIWPVRWPNSVRRLATRSGKFTASSWRFSSAKLRSNCGIGSHGEKSDPVWQYIAWKNATDLLQRQSIGTMHSRERDLEHKGTPITPLPLISSFPRKRESTLRSSTAPVTASPVVPPDRQGPVPDRNRRGGSLCPPAETHNTPLISSFPLSLSPTLIGERESTFQSSTALVTTSPVVPPGRHSAPRSSRGQALSGRP